MQPDVPFRDAVARAVAYLESPEASASLERDPYWPKWRSPWWHVMALEEAGQVAAIPERAARSLMEATRRHFVPLFPRQASELPAGKDWALDVICHCALGSLLRVLLARGLDGEEAIPWSRGWFARYQLPDGGFNCDEKAYTRSEPRSSILSTLPPLEYLLARHRLQPLGQAELEVLDRGAAYLLAHRLVCSIRTGHVVRREWLEPSFPRFYEYDALRGLRFLVRWAEARRRPLARQALVVALVTVARWFAPGFPEQPRRWHESHETRLSTAPGESGWGPGQIFPLLLELREGRHGRALLEHEWREVQRGVQRLEARRLLT